jgi:hypothetical protein
VTSSSQRQRDGQPQYPISPLPVAGFHGDSLTSTDPGNILFPDSATAWLGEHMNREHLNESISVCNDVDVSVAAERCLFQKSGSWYNA